MWRRVFVIFVFGLIILLKMSFLLIALFLTSVQTLPEKTCNEFKIGNQYYEKEVLWLDLGRPFNLNMYKPTNTLFFSYSIPKTYSETDFQLAYYNLHTKEYQTIAGIKGGCTVAIDSVLKEIYMGGSDGIYKYNMLTNDADFYKERNKNIWSLFYKKKLFYISYPDQRLHLEIDGTFAKVKEFEDFETDIFFVTNSSELYFANKTGLYKFERDTMKVVVVNELMTVRQIVEDNDYNLYIVTNYGILLKGKYDGFKRILNVNNVYGLAFDKDNNFIISDRNSIIRLKPSLEGCQS